MSLIRILVVEDNPAEVALLRYALDAHGEPHCLQVFEEGAAALRFVRAHRVSTPKPEPCLIILDLHLPRYDGMEILREIAATPPLRHIHVLVMSNTPNPGESAEITALGATYRQKPASLEEFAPFVEMVIAICKGSLSTAG